MNVSNSSLLLLFLHKSHLQGRSQLVRYVSWYWWHAWEVANQTGQTQLLKQFLYGKLTEGKHSKHKLTDNQAKCLDDCGLQCSWDKTTKCQTGIYRLIKMDFALCYGDILIHILVHMFCSITLNVFGHFGCCQRVKFSVSAPPGLEENEWEHNCSIMQSIRSDDIIGQMIKEFLSNTLKAC